MLIINTKRKIAYSNIVYLIINIEISFHTYPMSIIVMKRPSINDPLYKCFWIWVSGFTFEIQIFSHFCRFLASYGNFLRGNYSKKIYIRILINHVITFSLYNSILINTLLLTLHRKLNLGCHRWQIHLVFGLTSKFCFVMWWSCHKCIRISTFPSICVIRHVNLLPSIPIFFIPKYLGQWISSMRDAWQGNALSHSNRLTIIVKSNFWRTRRIYN